MDHERVSVASLFSGAVREEKFVELVPSEMPRLFERVAFHSLVERKIDQACTELRSLGAVVLHPRHASYPAAFRYLEKPPLFLSCLGNLEALSAPSRLAIVGSRDLSFRTEQWMEHHLAQVLRGPRAPVIVSGGARGADQAAHLAAIRARQPTVVFLPSGLGRIFPKDLQSWVKPVLDNDGVFVSLCAPNEEVRRHRFEERNRLIAALSHGVFIVEASRRSGSMMTARLATELGRDTCVLPSFPGEPAGQGTLDLLVNGAELIRDADDLLTFIGRVSVSVSAGASTVRATEEQLGKSVVPGLSDDAPEAANEQELSDPVRATTDDSVPRALERPAGGDREESVREPHRDEGRQLTFS